MANPEDKFPENVRGPFFVDEGCISCGLCMEKAPYNFTFTVCFKHAFWNKQPETEEEQEQCMEALKSCPVDAIGFQ